MWSILLNQTSKSSTGLSVRKKGESILTDLIDSHQMVRSLSVSQEYIKYDLCWAFMADSGDSRGFTNKESVLFPSTYVLAVTGLV